MEQIVLPKTSLAMEEAELLRWLRADGDPVQADEPVCEVDTDKATLEIPAPRAGILRIRIPEGTVRVGEVLGYVGDPEELMPMEIGAAGEGASAPAGPAPEPVDTASSGKLAVEALSERSRRSASPVARKRAKELGVDLGAVRGTGPDGRITLEDVERAVVARTSPEALDADRVRAAIAAQVTATWQQTPHINVLAEFPAGDLKLAHARAKTSEPGVTYTDLLLAVVARALVEVPFLNGTWEEGFVLAHAVHLGFAVATEAGVLVPVIRDAPARSIEEISTERRRLSSLALAGELTLNDMVGGTATLSNLGGYPVDLFTPVINGPQVCLVTAGRIRDRPAVFDGDVVVRPSIWIGVAIDHRAADGVAGAKLLQAIADQFQQLASL